MPGSLQKRRKALCRMASVIKALAGDLDLDPSDVRYVLHRLSNEGPAFVTKTLPEFSKYALASLEAGRLLKGRDVGLTSFATSSNGAPRFMRGLLSEAIEGDAYALYRIRQFCDYFYKVAFDFEEEVIKKAEARYVQTDCETGNFDRRIASYARTAMFLLLPEIGRYQPHQLLAKGTRFGPGSFAGSSDLSIRVEVYKKLPAETIGLTRRDLRAYSGYFQSYPGAGNKRTNLNVDGSLTVTKSERPIVVSEGRTAELCFVPKDSRGPRVISKEPLHLLRAQMGVETVLKDILEDGTQRRINFRSQGINQELARRSSQDKKHSTMDLKDASDRVSNDLVRFLLDGTPLGTFVQRIRSTHVRLPSGDIHRLKKFANMGSGVCFPILSLVVYLAGVVACKLAGAGSYERAGQSVYVYGDDLIVPSYAWTQTHYVLEALGLKVNTSKSFTLGNFRESCGADYMGGVDVRPVRLRLSSAKLQNLSAYRNGIFPVDNDPAALQIERHCRELVDAGLSLTAEYWYRMLERRLGELPLVSRESPALGRYDPSAMVPDLATKAYVPVVTKVRSAYSCGIKGLGKALKPSKSDQTESIGEIQSRHSGIEWQLLNWSQGGQQDDWYRTPLRYSVSLKRRVVTSAQIGSFGLPSDPKALFGL